MGARILLSRGTPHLQRQRSLPRALQHGPRNKSRSFSHSISLHLRTSELKPADLKSLVANPTRLWSAIHDTAKWGTGPSYNILNKPDLETGLSRLTLSDADKQARHWFEETAESLSCRVYVDEIGNQFAIRPGYNKDANDRAAATFAGSHLDSQPLGGRFDGVLGVCAGLEMLQVLEENWIETEGPVGVVNWTNEEGARFPISMLGSGVWAGAQGLEQMYDLQENEAFVKNGKRATLREELQRIGYRGDVKASATHGVRMGGHFELHIEQGPYLTRANQQIGAVEGVQGYKWFEVTVKGEACHTGATGFADRIDALYWASNAIWKVREIADKVKGLASVGVIKAEPGSVNTVPSEVMFTLDIRHPDDQKVSDIEAAVADYFLGLEKESVIQNGRGVKVEMKQIFHSAAIKFDQQAVQCVEDSAQGLFGKPGVRRMASGAGHDSVNTQKHCPTAMIFVPCRDGISHHPTEWCDMEDCANGTSVLLQSVLRYDQIRHSMGHFD